MEGIGKGHAEMIQRIYGGARLMRAGRCSLSGQVYLITVCTQRRFPVLSGLTEARLVVQEFRLASEERKARTLSYVIMPDHFHWLVRLGSVSDLSGLVKQVKARSAQQINRLRSRSGTVWQRGFHDRAVRRDENIRNIARYVVANPIRAGLVEDLGRYPFWDAVWLEPGDSDLDLLES